MTWGLPFPTAGREAPWTTPARRPGDVFHDAPVHRLPRALVRARRRPPRPRSGRNHALPPSSPSLRRCMLGCPASRLHGFTTLCRTTYWLVLAPRPSRIAPRAPVSLPCVALTYVPRLLIRPPYRQLFDRGDRLPRHDGRRPRHHGDDHPVTGPQPAASSKGTRTVLLRSSHSGTGRPLPRRNAGLNSFDV